MAVRRKSQNFLQDKLIPFLKKYGIFILVFFLVAPMLYRWIMKLITSVKETNMDMAKKQNTAENSQNNPNIVKQKTETIKKKYPNISTQRMEELKDITARVAYALGTNIEDNHQLFGGVVELFNVKAWVEDEKEVIKQLKKTPGTFPIVEDLYYSVYTKSKNLKSDLLKYLSKKDLDVLSKHYRAYGYKFI